MERLFSSSRKEISTGKRDFLKGSPKFPKGSICLFLLVPGLLAWIVFDRETTKVIKDGFANVPVRSVWAFGA